MRIVQPSVLFMRPAYLVEDNPDIRARLIPALAELADYAVVGIAEGEAEAVEWLTNHRVEADLVVLDIFLKQGTGLGVLAKRARYVDGCRIVVLTNSATDAMRRKCMSLGAEAVFDKTAELDEFFAHCRNSARIDQ